MTVAPLVESAAGRIILHFDSLDHAMKLLKPWPAEGLRVDAADKINRALESVGLTVEVRVRGRAIAELGLGGTHGSLLRLIGVTT